MSRVKLLPVSARSQAVQTRAEGDRRCALRNIDNTLPRSGVATRSGSNGGTVRYPRAQSPVTIRLKILPELG